MTTPSTPSTDKGSSTSSSGASSTTASTTTPASGTSAVPAGAVTDSTTTPTTPTTPTTSEPEVDTLAVTDEELAGMDIHYTHAGQIRQALGQLRNARGQGNATLVADAEKRLTALGFDLAARERGSSTTEGRSVDASKQPPEGRSATPPTTVRTDAPKPATPVSTTPTTTVTPSTAATSSSTTASPSTAQTPPAKPAGK